MICNDLKLTANKIIHFAQTFLKIYFYYDTSLITPFLYEYKKEGTVYFNNCPKIVKMFKSYENSYQFTLNTCIYKYQFIQFYLVFFYRYNDPNILSYV